VFIALKPHGGVTLGAEHRIGMLGHGLHNKRTRGYPKRLTARRTKKETP